MYIMENEENTVYWIAVVHRQSWHKNDPSNKLIYIKVKSSQSAQVIKVYV